MLSNLSQSSSIAASTIKKSAARFRLLELGIRAAPPTRRANGTGAQEGLKARAKPVPPQPTRMNRRTNAEEGEIPVITSIKRDLASSSIPAAVMTDRAHDILRGSW